MVVDGNSQSLSTYQPGLSSLDNNHVTGASSYGQGQSPKGHTQQYQSFYKNKDSAPLFETNAIPVSNQKQQIAQPPTTSDLLKRSRTSSVTKTTTKSGFAMKTAFSRNRKSKYFLKKKKTAQLPQDGSGLVKNIGTSRINPASKKTTPKVSVMWVKKGESSSTIPASKETTGPALQNGGSTEKETAQLPQDGALLVENIGSSRINPASKKTTQSPKVSVMWVKKGESSSTIPASKETTRPPLQNPLESVQNGGTSTSLASTEKETAQLPNDGSLLVENIGSSRINPASKKTTQSPKVSAVWVEKGESSSTIPQGEKKTQPSISVGSAELENGTATATTLASEQNQRVRHKKKKIPAKPIQEPRICKDHILWEGFEERIEPLEEMCLLCERDLANKIEYEEYDPYIERYNPAENAVLSCGHVFHTVCLQFSIPEENCRDPPCAICASLY